VLQRTLQLSPDMFAAWMNLGLCLDKLGRPAEAIPAFERARELDPSNTETMNQLVDTFFKLGKFKKAVEVCRSYLEEDPTSIRIHAALAMSLINRAQMKEAEEIALKGLALDPEGENLNYVIGKILQGRRRYEEAAAAYEKEIKAHKRNVNAFQSLHEACLELGDLDRSLRALEEAAGLFRDDYSIQFALAKTSLRKGVATDAALAAARRAVELNADSTEAWDALSGLEKLR